MFVTMIRLKQPSIQSIFTRNERCGDWDLFALRGSRQDGLGAIDVAGAVAPHPPTNTWEPIAKRQDTQISTERWGTRLEQHGDWVSTKDGGRQSKGDSGARCTFGNFSSLHSMSSWVLCSRTCAGGPRPFSARQGSRLTALETHQSHMHDTIVQLFDSSCTSRRCWFVLFSMRYCWPVLGPRCSIYLWNS
jgi:hypothetical protein